eukprot:9240137-Heterocapsa_arctica.AAC.1
MCASQSSGLPRAAEEGVPPRHLLPPSPRYPPGREPPAPSVCVASSEALSPSCLSLVGAASPLQVAVVAPRRVGTGTASPPQVAVVVPRRVGTSGGEPLPKRSALGGADRWLRTKRLNDLYSCLVV